MGLCSMLLMLSVNGASSCSQIWKWDVMPPVATSSNLLGRFRQHLYVLLPVFFSTSVKMIICMGDLEHTLFPCYFLDVV